MFSYITAHPLYKEGMPRVHAIIDYTKELSVYDKVAASSVGLFILVGVISPFASPILVSPFLISSVLKTAWHAAQFFYLKRSLPPFERKEYMKREQIFTQTHLEVLQKHVSVFTHRDEMVRSFQNCKTFAKGMIPVIGVIILIFSKKPPTSLKLSDTWTDLNALKYHIRYLKLTPHQ